MGDIVTETAQAIMAWRFFLFEKGRAVQRLNDPRWTNRLPPPPPIPLRFAKRVLFASCLSAWLVRTVFVRPGCFCCPPVYFRPFALFATFYGAPGLGIGNELEFPNHTLRMIAVYGTSKTEDSGRHVLR